MKTDKEMKSAKRAAAIAGVLHCIRTEEELSCRDEAPTTRFGPPTPLNTWGMSGRQAQMQLRNLMQIKAFHGTRRY